MEDFVQSTRRWYRQGRPERCRRVVRLPKSRIKRYGFEVVKYVATTRRWYDREKPRDAGAATPAKVKR